MTVRSITGTWVTDELKMALKQGYILQTIYEVWHFNELSQYDLATRSGGLFIEYVNTFLKVKEEASGWPDLCMNEESKQRYIQQYHNKEGIQHKYDKIKEIPG